MSNNYPVRARAVSEILDTALRIYRGHFIILLGITAAALVPEGILEGLMILAFPGAEMESLQNSLTSLFSSFATMALVIAISSSYLGNEFTIGSAYSKGLKRFWSIAGANILAGLMIFLPVFFIALCLVAVASSTTGVLFTIVLMILFLPVIIYLSTRWSLRSQAIILENIGSTDGLRRTWNLTRNHFWRVMGTSFAASLLAIMLNLLPFLFVDFILSSLGINQQITQLVDLVVQQVSIILGLPFTVAVQVLIYYDLRIRKEGFDLQVRAEEPQLAV